MRQILLFSILIIGFFTKCNSTNNSNDKKHNDTIPTTESNIEEVSIDNILIDKIDESSEIYSVNGDCVFVIQLTTKESDSLETADPDSYEIYSENANNAAMNASELLDKLGIKSEWSDKRYEKFNDIDKKYLIDTRLKNIAGKYCLFFKTKTKPELIEIESLTEDLLLKYFKK